jgi:hypothetical protein
VLLDIYEWIKDNDVDDDLDFMKIDLGKCPINKKVSKNFTEYMKIAE